MAKKMHFRETTEEKACLLTSGQEEERQKLLGISFEVTVYAKVPLANNVEKILLLFSPPSDPHIFFLGLTAL